MKVTFATLMFLLIINSNSPVLAQGNPSFGATTYPYLGPAQYGAIGLPRGEIMFSNTNTQNQFYLMQNGFMSSSGSFQYRTASVASAFGLDNGNIFFFTAPSGTANTNIPLVARLIMSNDGNMRVGSQGSTAKGRLHIGAEDKSVKSALSIRQSNDDNYGFDFGLDLSSSGNLFLQRVVGDVKFGVMEFNRNNGNIGVGVTPKSKLHIAAPDKSVSSAISIRQSNSDPYGFDIGLDQSLNGNMFLYRVFADVKYSVMEFDRANGNIGIGTSLVPDAKLTVKGTVHASEVKVDLLGAVAPDYVFDKGYNLPTLESIQKYIDQHKHLPEVPSAKEMEINGINLGEMNMLLLKKIEEMTLHLIDQNKLLLQLQESGRASADASAKRIEELTLCLIAFKGEIEAAKTNAEKMQLEIDQLKK